jgi:hypothetical protein
MGSAGVVGGEAMADMAMASGWRALVSDIMAAITATDTLTSMVTLTVSLRRCRLRWLLCGPTARDDTVWMARTARSGLRLIYIDGRINPPAHPRRVFRCTNLRRKWRISDNTTRAIDKLCQSTAYTIHPVFNNEATTSLLTF